MLEVWIYNIPITLFKMWKTHHARQVAKKQERRFFPCPPQPKITLWNVTVYCQHEKCVVPQPQADKLWSRWKEQREEIGNRSTKVAARSRDRKLDRATLSQDRSLNKGFVLRPGSHNEERVQRPSGKRQTRHLGPLKKNRGSPTATTTSLLGRLWSVCSVMFWV